MTQPARSLHPDGFVVGRDYSRDEIHAAVGGSKRACLPTKDGVVVAACLLTSFSPEAPRVMLCGVGPQLTPMSTRLAQQRLPLPIFIKLGVGRWRFEGRFVVAGTLTSGERFERYVARSERDISDVSFVVLFEPTSL